MDTLDTLLEYVIEHVDHRDEPNVGRVHPARLIAVCGLCRCGAHNAEDDPAACAECSRVIAVSTVE